MKVDYDFNANTMTRTCPVCGYKITNVRVGNKIIEGDEEFIEIEETFHSEKKNRFSDIIAHSIYVCPKCGVLQLWT